MPPDLVLASTSPYRRRLLDAAGFAFRVRDPRVDEAAVKALALPPRALAERLARAKADALLIQESEAVLIGADQVAMIEGEVLDKPGHRDRAFDQLRRLSGRTHELITAVAVRYGDRLLAHTDVGALTMRPLSDEQIAAYLDIDQPWDCAGSYKFESLGASLFAATQVEDPTAVIGLPMRALGRILAEFGVVAAGR